MTSLVHTDIDWPSLAEIWTVLILGAGFNTTVVMIGVTMLGIAAGVVGTFAVLRKRALMGDALSHATLPGMAAAFLVAVALGAEGRSLPVLLFGASVSGIIGVLTVQAIVRFTRLPEDAAIGAVLSVFFGFGFVLLSHIQGLDTGDQGGISKFIYGQTAAMRVADAIAIGVSALIVGLIAAGLFKEFRLVCFDPEFAGTQGWPVSVVDLLMMTLVVVVTVIGLQAVGLILVVALVIIPPAAARFWSERLWVVTAISAVIGGLSGYMGAAASALFPKFPAGGVIVLVAGALFLLSLLLAPERGVLFAAIRQIALRIEVAQQHVLRALFEAEETGRVGEDNSMPLADLEKERRWSRPWLEFVVRSLTLRGRVARQDMSLRLTDRGRLEARRLTRNHRLWEQFLVAYADLAPSHVDRSADFVEHVLSPEMVAELERQLAEIGRLPAPSMPDSVHPIGTGTSEPQEATT